MGRKQQRHNISDGIHDDIIRSGFCVVAEVTNGDRRVPGHYKFGQARDASTKLRRELSGKGVNVYVAVIAYQPEPTPWDVFDTRGIDFVCRADYGNADALPTLDMCIGLIPGDQRSTAKQILRLAEQDEPIGRLLTPQLDWETYQATYPGLTNGATLDEYLGRMGGYKGHFLEQETARRLARDGVAIHVRVPYHKRNTLKDADTVSFGPENAILEPFRDRTFDVDYESNKVRQRKVA
ncbi:hypothetical protein COV18_05670 [Candidatus Woesearchaeota archaeon CG10_big_fil_rev_8_21_14_0_10_37_12]|nr:MAG: hypothetical protein COV18_05670 [Candidatus Woesearchaeota archaeon CG10_big_fil_rev_8_21_14_0_10_37_12]